jgi:hypothetical protein
MRRVAYEDGLWELGRLGVMPLVCNGGRLGGLAGFAVNGGDMGGGEAVIAAIPSTTPPSSSVRSIATSSAQSMATPGRSKLLT